VTHLVALLDSLAIAISALAFLVAVVTLYVTALRRADIYVDQVEGAPRSAIKGHIFTGERVVDAAVTLELVISNTGARAGVLQFLNLTLDPERRHKAWPHGPVDAASSEPRSLPRGLQGGDVDVLRPTLTIPLPATTPEDVAVAFAEQALEVEIQYSFQRSGRRKRRETVRRQLRIPLSLSTFRGQVIAQWINPGVPVDQTLIDSLREASS